jgi:hypothetical protein
MKETYVTTRNKMEQPGTERYKQDQQTGDFCH